MTAEVALYTAVLGLPDTREFAHLVRLFSVDYLITAAHGLDIWCFYDIIRCEPVIVSCCYRKAQQSANKHLTFLSNGVIMVPENERRDTHYETIEIKETQRHLRTTGRG